MLSSDKSQSTPGIYIDIYSTRPKVFEHIEFVAQVAHDKDTYATSDISQKHHFKYLKTTSYSRLQREALFRLYQSSNIVSLP